MKMTDDPADETYQKELDPLVESSFGELKWIVAAWIINVSWVVGYSGWFGSYPGNETLEDTGSTFVMGIPSWVFWGVLIPWGGATGFTIWFALTKMQDHVLPDSPAEMDCNAEDQDG